MRSSQALVSLPVLLLAACCCGGAKAPVESLEDDRVTSLAAASGIDEDVLRRALTAHGFAVALGDVDGENATTLTVIDYSLPSTERRLWVLDLDTAEVLFNELVAHGKNSGANRATSFSNESGSLQSSLGVFRTARTYEGKHGYSLRLKGLEPGFNDHAKKRAIVMHGASYVSEAFIAEHGRIGRSWGCPAVPVDVASAVIDVIEGGTLLVSYYPDEDWLESSQYLHCE